MLGILLPRHWNTVIRQSYLPWIMYWMPRNMNHPTAGNLVCFKQTQLPNPNSFCYKTGLIKNIYMKLPFGGFELQVWLSYWLCFNTQMKAFISLHSFFFSLVKDHCSCLTAEHIFWSPSQSPWVLSVCQHFHWGPWFQKCKYWLDISQAPFLKQFQNPPC